MLGEQVGVEERQLHRVGDLLDLPVEAAHVGVGDVGHLLEDQLLDLGPGQALEQQSGPGVHAQRVTRAQGLALEAGGQLAHPLVVGPAHHDGAGPAVDDLLQGDQLAGAVGRPGQDDGEGVVEHHLGAALEALGHLGQDGDPHLAAARHDVDGLVLVDPEDRAVGRGGLGELVDLVAERGDLVARLPEGVGELLVLAHRVGQLALGLQQALLQGAHPLGRVLEATAEDEDLVLERGGLLAQLVLARLALRIGVSVLFDGNHLPDVGSCPDRLAPGLVGTLSPPGSRSGRPQWAAADRHL